MAPDLIIYTDGAARGNPGPAASGFVVFSANNRIYEESKYLEVATNNIAEHTAVLMALEWLQKNAHLIIHHPLTGMPLHLAGLL